LVSSFAFAQGQGGRGGRGGPPRPAQEAAPWDITGYWVSFVTEDWRFRIMLAPKGDFSGVPLNQEGTRVGNTWDPAKDDADGNQCKAFGAAALMRMPSRFHITWQDPETLKIESDAGTQTRLLHFTGSNPGGAASWQGYSSAAWERQLNRSRGGQGQPGAGDSTGGTLHVQTSNLKAGYLRRNGAPYSDKATVNEYFDLLREADGSQWLIVKTIVTDPTYLNEPFITSSNLRKQADNKGWNPTPCTSK